MNGLTEHLELLNTIEKYFRICKTATIKGLGVLDVSETKGMVHLKFGCPDEYFPEYSFNVEFQVTKDFFEKNLKKLLEVNNV